MQLNVCMSAYNTQRRQASTKLQYEPVSFSIKPTFPLSVLSFPWLHMSAVSLLSKKGLRYLLYPFISLWMVGGRISPSFTSALSNELSNNLRTKTGERKKERKRCGKTEIRIIFRFSSRCAFTRRIPLRERLTIQRICRVSIEFHHKSLKPCWVGEKTGD